MPVLAPQQARPMRQLSSFFSFLFFFFVSCVFVIVFFLRLCGNHDPDAGSRPIPCPIDSSHSVSEDNVQSHVKKCPFRKQALALESQPYYSKGINGSPDDDYMDSAAKRNAILQLSAKDFQALLEKVKSIHSAISVVLLDSYVIPDACSAWLKQQHLDRKLPYQEKHAMQQTSIVGNIEATGILRKPNEPTESFYQEVEGSGHFGRDESQVSAVVEFGSGRGYLTQMLTDCYGLSQVCLIERNYKLKANLSSTQSDTSNRLASIIVRHALKPFSNSLASTFFP